MGSARRRLLRRGGPSLGKGRCAAGAPDSARLGCSSSAAARARRVNEAALPSVRGEGSKTSAPAPLPAAPKSTPLHSALPSAGGVFFREIWSDSGFFFCQGAVPCLRPSLVLPPSRSAALLQRARDACRLLLLVVVAPWGKKKSCFEASK